MVPTWERFIRESATLNENEQKKNDDLKYFIVTYFEKNYIGERKKNGSRKKARFPIELWSVHESTINGK